MELDTHTEVETSNNVSTEQTNQTTQADRTEPVEKKYATPYLDRFNSETLEIGEGKIINLGDLWVSLCSLSDVALAVLAKMDWLKNSENVRDKLLYDGYMSIKVTYHVNKKVVEHNVSMYEMAKKVVGFSDVYLHCDFIGPTIGSNWRWTIDKKVKEERGFDPFGLAKTELGIKLKDAHMVLLVKIFRMYLMETVRRVFPRTRTQQNWKSSDAVYKGGGIERTSNDFVAFVDELLKLYDSVVCLSPDLTEVKAVVNNAVTLGKYEASQKREVRQRKHIMEANYKQVVNAKLGVEDISSGVGKQKINSNMTKKSNTTNADINVNAETKQTVQKPSMWNKDKTLVDKYVERGEYARKEAVVNTTEAVGTTVENTDSDKQNQQNQQKRTVKSGNNKNNKKNVNQQKVNEQKDLTPEELEKQGYKTVKRNDKQKKPNTGKANVSTK